MEKLNCLNAIQYLLTDIDDTLTTDGKLLPEVLQALWDLKRAGIQVIPVTGACAGWCDQIARLWPVDAVIGENGAFVMFQSTNGHFNVEYWLDDHNRLANQTYLKLICKSAFEHFPQLKFAKDQHYRLCDVAIDYNQEVNDFPLALMPSVIDFFAQQGITAKYSSIHINLWVGQYNKLNMAKRYLSQYKGLTETDIETKVAFVGDAPNDEPMFEFFDKSFGVANIEPHLAVLKAKPNQILTQPAGLGFVELSRRLIHAK